jgi:hydrogenase maturation protease
MTVVLGAGNRWRRDDGAGRDVAHRLRQRLPESARVVEVSGEATELLAAWEGAEAAVVVDAVSSGSPPGTVHRFDAAAEPLPASLTTPSSHGFGVAQAVELGRRLGRLPPRLVVYGVEGEDFGHGEGLSPTVERAVGEVVEAVVGEVIGRTSPRSPAECSRPATVGSGGPPRP